MLWLTSGTTAYLSFLDDRSIVEVATGAVTAGGAYFLSSRAFRAAGLSYTSDLPHLWRLGAAVRTSAAETCAVFVALVRRLIGRMVAQGALPVGDESFLGPGAVAFIPATTVEAGLAPNTVEGVARVESGHIGDSMAWLILGAPAAGISYLVALR